MNSLPQVRSQCEYPVKKVVSPQIELPAEYILVEKAGQGSFGEIYKIYNTITKTLHACKVEFKDARSQNQQLLLIKEFRVFQQLKSIPQVPQPYQLIQQQEYNIIIMPYCGSGNLEELRKKQIGEKFSEHCIVRLAYCLISVIEACHERKYVHRDIKPENFLVGSYGDQHTVYLIDFGLAKQYVDPQGIHIPQAENKGMVGTARYTSINSHLGAEQSRRDDLEAMCYLPWQNFNCQTRSEKFQKILDSKQKFASGQLEINVPPILRAIYDHAKDLRFCEQPNYTKMKEMCRSGFSSERPYCFDWCNSDCKMKPYEDLLNDGISELASEFSAIRKQKGGTTEQISTMVKKTLPCQEIQEVDEDSISEMPQIQTITKFFNNKKH